MGMWNPWRGAVVLVRAVNIALFMRETKSGQLIQAGLKRQLSLTRRLKKNEEWL